MSALTIVRGDDRSFAGVVTDRDTGNRIDLTGAQQLTFTVKRQRSDTTLVLQKTLGHGVAITDAPNGAFIVNLYAVDTAGLSDAYVWDLELRDVSAITTTVASGTLLIQGDITGPSYPADTLLTVAEAREHITTALGDSAVQRLIDANTMAINQRAGPVGTLSLVLYPRNSSMLFFDRPIGTVTSIVEYFNDPVGISGVTLDSTDYRIQSGGLVLERWGYGTHPADWWSHRVELAYVPADDTAERRRVLIKLCELDLNRKPGLSGMALGDYSEQSRNEPYNDEREAILASLVPSALTFA